MNLDQAIETLETAAPDPGSGLPLDIFLLLSRLTPMVNVDLLIQDEGGRTLLSWRDDPYAGAGWHIPGGIVRFKETFHQRVRKVAESEIGTAVAFDPDPMAIHQVIRPHDTRGHFISLLYKCFVSSEFTPENKGLTPRTPGFLKWHDACPNDLIEVHGMYRNYLAGQRQPQVTREAMP